MHTTRYDVRQFRRDMVGLGLNRVGLAREAEVHHSSVYRFLSGRHQAPPMAKKLAFALGFPVKRYVREPRKRARRRVS